MSRRLGRVYSIVSMEKFGVFGRNEGVSWTAVNAEACSNGTYESIVFRVDVCSPRNAAPVAGCVHAAINVAVSRTAVHGIATRSSVLLYALLYTLYALRRARRDPCTRLTVTACVRNVIPSCTAWAPLVAPGRNSVIARQVTRRYRENP